MSHTRLISFLGLGNPKKYPDTLYEPTRYQLERDGQTSQETPLLEAALLELIPEIDCIYVLGTSEVKAEWMSSGRFDRFVSQKPKFEELPNGNTPDDRWKIFNAMQRALSLDFVAGCGETKIPSEIILDITHGFRLQPVLGLAALQYQLSEWKRKRIANLPSIRVLYGAWEARNKETNVSPIWDLTEFVTAAQWNAAIDALLRYGRADDFRQLGAIEGKKRIKDAKISGMERTELKGASFPRYLGEKASDLADDIATNRLQHLLTNSAPALLNLLEKEEATRFECSFPPLKAAMQQLRRSVKPLCAENTLGKEGLTASAHLARLMGDMERYAEQASTIRECLVTHFGQQIGCTEQMIEPGCEGISKQREDLERSWSEKCKTYRKVKSQSDDNSVMVENLKLAISVVNARNDIEHCGINQQPSSAKRLRTALQESADSFSSIILQGCQTSEVNEQKRNLPFLNLSNHPLTTWSETQKTAALELGFCELAELPEGMPLVSPFATEDEVAIQAERLADRAAELSVGGAFVAGDFSFSFALIHALQRRGIRCFAATAERQVVTEQQGDGSVERCSVFRFIRWREYLS